MPDVPNEMMISARGLGKQYPSAGRELTVLADVDLDVDPEGVVAILGPSGSGKTTLLGLLAGLDTPSTGSVRLAGQDLGVLSEDERAKFRSENVGFVFQTFHLLPSLTAIENVLVPLELRGVKTASEGQSIRKKATDLLDRVGLTDRIDHYPAQLSGGEQQRVALARAFANDPKILFADEPTGNLDSVTGDSIIEAMESLNRVIRTTIVLVTHDLKLAERAHRVIRLDAGRVVSDEKVTAAR
jgi:putative ABC transport system ATP-binding protein